MEEQTRLNILQLTKANIGALGSTIYDDLLNSFIDSAVPMIEREGITLNLEQTDDRSIVVGYASWLFWQRKQPNMPMPRWLRYSMNNKLMQQKAVIPYE